jgi:uncharacterized protein YycO
MATITLQFSTGNDLESWAIRSFQRAWPTHVDYVLEDGQLLGARFPDGVQVRPSDYMKFTRTERVDIVVPYFKETAFKTFIKEQVGKPYDWLAIISFSCIVACNRNWRQEDAWFCSELIAAAFEYSGITRQLAPTINRLTPRDIYLVVSAIAPVGGDETDWVLAA